MVGLGYVGLPLAHAFAKKGYGVIGFDVNENRITELTEGKDSTNELTDDQLKNVDIDYTTDPGKIAGADIVIMALPTPIDDDNNPDITILKQASETVGANMKKGAIVVYESTVYPGTTEEICGPILEEASGMKCGEDFFLGYSPERINPGDKEHTVEKIVKVVAGQDEKTTDTLCELYDSVIVAGTHRASSIKVAEMGKAIENAQRDLNIAFINEVAMLCNKIGISTKDVLAAAQTKWNFLPFQPGLVGGHCIGVDPYYLVEKAKQLGMDTHVITAGRSTNDGMSSFVSVHVGDTLGDKKNGAKVLVLGLTFKEDIPDTRNSKSGEVVRQLDAIGCDVYVNDPQLGDYLIEKDGMKTGSLDDGPFDAILLLVPHKEYLDVGTEGLIAATKDGGIIYDLKSILDKGKIEKSGRKYLAL